jgi:hypothetical protein
MRSPRKPPLPSAAVLRRNTARHNRGAAAPGAEAAATAVAAVKQTLMRKSSSVRRLFMWLDKGYAGRVSGADLAEGMLRLGESAAEGQPCCHRAALSRATAQQTPLSLEKHRDFPVRRLVSPRKKSHTPCCCCDALRPGARRPRIDHGEPRPRPVLHRPARKRGAPPPFPPPSPALQPAPRSLPDCTACAWHALVGRWPARACADVVPCCLLGWALPHGDLPHDASWGACTGEL